MSYISIDLGTSYIKAGCYSDELRELAVCRAPVHYSKVADRVTFSAGDYFEDVLRTVKECVDQSGVNEVSRITLTGQAESLVILDKQGNAAGEAISWMDNRSVRQCNELAGVFSPEACYDRTGQPEILPTWPATKLLWLRQEDAETFNAAWKFLLLKDYIIYQLTGEMTGEYSIYNFTYYFDIHNKRYMQDMLDYIGVSENQLPLLSEPCTDVGRIKPELADVLGICKSAVVNAGTLDHFAGMIGTGNIKAGMISESTGTVLTIATLVEKQSLSGYKIACHYGPFPDSRVALAVCESGGICLEWFRNCFMDGVDYQTLDDTLKKRGRGKNILFLPYVNGINAPGFEQDMKGVFCGFDVTADSYDFAYAVMEGVAHMLEENIQAFREMGVDARAVISTGGGAKSSVWAQMKADITGMNVEIPVNTEAACLGAAVIGAVASGAARSYPDAVRQAVRISKKFYPSGGGEVAARRAQYRKLLSLHSDYFKGCGGG